MESSQIKLISQASVDEVNHLMKLKKQMSDEEFYTLIFKTLNQFISDKDVVEKLIKLATHTWEISVILAMKDETWFSEGILFLTRSFRSLMREDKDKALSIIEECYPNIHESLACWHDAFFLQNLSDSNNPRHIARACFRMLGDTVESVHGPHVDFIYKMFINLKSSPIFGRPKNVSLGKKISELTRIKILGEIYKDNLLGVSISQWRNIANHTSYRYNRDSQNIICHYGNNNTSTVQITIEELMQLMMTLNKLQALQKIAVDFFIVEFIDEVDFHKMNNIGLTVETIIGQIGNNLGLNGYKVISAENNSKDLTFKLEDTDSKGVSGFKETIPILYIYLMMLKEKGLNPIFELFDIDGNKLTQVSIKRKSNG